MLDCNMQWKGLKSDQNSSLLLKPTPNLEVLVNQFDNATPDNNKDSAYIFSILNIMILTKCIILKYITKLNLCPCSI